MMRGRPWRAQLVYWAGMLLLVNGWYVGGLAQPPASAQLPASASCGRWPSRVSSRPLPTGRKSASSSPGLLSIGMTPACSRWAPRWKVEPLRL